MSRRQKRQDQAWPTPQSLSNLPISSGRFIAQDSMKVSDTLLYFPSNGIARDFPWQPALANFIANWNDFRSIDDVSLDLQGLPTLEAFAAWVRRLQQHLLPSIGLNLAGGVTRWVARKYWQSLSSNVDLAQTQSRLIELASSGVLLAEATLLDRCVQGAGTSCKRRVKSLGVLVDSRMPDSNFYLTFLFQHLQRYERSTDVMVIDLSDDITTESRYRSRLKRTSRSSAINVTCVGREEKLRFAKLLTAEGLPTDVVDFALFGNISHKSTAGGSRNALLLASPGQPLSMIDNGIVDPILTHRGRLKTGLSITDRDPFDYLHFDNLRSAIEFCGRAEIDFLGEHEQFIGGAIPQIINEHSTPQRVEIHSVCSHLKKSLLQARGKIIVTTSGTLEESMWATQTMSLMETASELTHPSLIRSGRRGNRALNAKYSLVTVPGVTISHQLALHNSVLTLDNADLLPPFGPLNQGHMQTFRALLFNSVSEGYTAYLPFATRVFGCPGVSAVGPQVASDPIRTYEVINACVPANFAAHGSETAKNLRALGRFFCEVGSLGEPDFYEYVRIAMLEKLCQATMRLDHTLSAADKESEMWVEAATRNLRALERIAIDQTLPNLSEGASASAGSREASSVQQLIARLGLLLLWWPDIVSVAERLRARGQTLGVAI